MIRERWHQVQVAVLAVALGVAAAAGAGEITPEAEKLLALLHAKTAGIECLNWRAAGASNSFSLTGSYRRGQGVRITHLSPDGEPAFDSYFLPNRYVKVWCNQGFAQTRLDGMDMFALPFVMPLLERAQLAALGRVEGETTADGREGRLRVQYAAPGHGIVPSRPGSVELVYALPECKLQQVRLRYGIGSEAAVLVVSAHQAVGAFAFPTRFRSGGYRQAYGGGLEVSQIDTKDGAAVRPPDLSGILVLRDDLDTAGLQAALAKEKDPQAQAALQYGLAMSLRRSSETANTTARDACLRAIELAPTAAAPRLLLLDLTLTAEPDKADALATELLARFPQTKTVVYSRMAMPVFSNEQPDRAKKLAWVERWLRDCPNSAAALRYAAMAYEMSGDSAKVAELYGTALARTTDPVMKTQYSLAQAKALAGAGKATEAGPLLAAAGTALAGMDMSDPRTAAMLQEFCAAQAKAGTLPEFIKTLAAKTEAEPKNTFLLLELASAYAAARDDERALPLYERLRKISPDNPHVLQALERIYSAKGMHAQRVALYEELLAQGEDGDVAHSIVSPLLAAYRGAGQTDKAQALAQRLLARQALPSGVLQAIASFYQESGEVDKSIAVHKRLVDAVAPEAGKSSLQLELARLLVKQDRREEARQLLDALLAAKPDGYVRSEAMRLDSELLRKTGQLEARRAALGAQLAKTPDDVALLEQAAYLATAAERFDEAADLYRRLAAARPDAASFTAWLAALGRQDQQAKRAAVYEVWFAKEPGAMRAHLVNYVDACVAAGKLDQAVATVRQHAAGTLFEAGAWARLGNALATAQRRDEACEALTNAVAKARSASERSQYRLQLARAQIAGNNLAAAEPLLRELAADTSNGYLATEAQDELAKILKQSGRMDEYVAEVKRKAGDKPGKDDLLRLAKALRSAGDHAGAADACDKLVALDPSADSFRALLDAVQRLRQPGREAAVIEAFIARHPEQGQGYAYSLFDAYQRDGKPEKALAAAEASTRARPRDGMAWSLLADQYQRARRWDDADKALMQAIAVAPDPAARLEPQLARGQLLMQRERWDEAAKWLRELLAGNPESGTQRRIRRDLLRALEQQGKLAEYLDTLEKAVKEKPGDKERLRDLVDACGVARRHEQAAAHAEALVALDPSASNYQSWIQELRNANQNKALPAAYEAFLARYPEQRRSHLGMLTSIWLKAGDLVKAKAAAEEHVKLRPGDARALGDLARVCTAAKAYDEALRNYDLAMAATGADASRKDDLAKGKFEVLVQAGRVEEATAAGTQLTEQAHADYVRSSAGRTLRDFLRQGGKLDAYLAEREATLAQQPTERGLAFLTETYLEQRNFQKAADCARKLVKLKPDRDYYSHLASALSGLNDSTGQIAVYREMLEKFPKDKSQALSNLMWAHHQAGHTDEALAFGAELARVEPGEGAAYFNMGSICQQAKRFDAAVGWYRKSIEQTGNKQTREMRQVELASALLQAGKTDEAGAIVTPLAKDSTDAQLRARAAQLQIKIMKASGKGEELLKSLEAQCRQAPTEALLVQLAMAYDEAGNRAAEADAYGRLVKLNPSSQYYGQWINALGQAEKPAEQAQALRELLARYPQEKGNWLSMLVGAHERAGELDKAIEMAKEAIDAQPQKGLATYELARLLRKAGRDADAMPYLEKAVALTTEDGMRQQRSIELASLYVKLARYEPAEKQLATVLELMAKTGQGYWNAAELTKAVRAVADNRADWVDRIMAAADAKPGDAVAQAVAAEVCARCDLKEDAAEFRSRVMDIAIKAALAQPADFGQQLTAAKACAAQGDPRRAAVYYERALALKPDENVYAALAGAYSMCNDPAKQAAIIEAMIQKFPRSRGSMIGSLASAYQGTREWDKAIALLRKGSEEFPESAPYLRTQLGSTLQAAGRPAEAIETYQALRREGTGKPATSAQGIQADWAVRRIAEIQLAAGERTKALEFLRAAREELRRDETRRWADQKIAELAAPAVAPPPK